MTTEAFLDCITDAPWRLHEAKIRHISDKNICPLIYVFGHKADSYPHREIVLKGYLTRQQIGEIIEAADSPEPTPLRTKLLEHVGLL